MPCEVSSCPPPVHLPNAERPLKRAGSDGCTALGAAHGRLRVSPYAPPPPFLPRAALQTSFPPPPPPAGRGLSSCLPAACSHRPIATSPSPAQAPRAVRSALTSVRPTIGASISVSELHIAATARHAQHGLCGVHTATALPCPNTQTGFWPGVVQPGTLISTVFF